MEIDWIMRFITICAVLQVTSAAYLGCYKERGRRRLFNQNAGAIKNGTLTPQRCYTLCGSLKYAYSGLAHGEICFCSNSTPTSLTLETGKCTTPCSGDIGSYCGSATHIDVWESITPVDVTVVTSPNVAQTGDQVSFMATVDAMNPYKMRLNYGDDAGVTRYTTSGTGLLNKTYYMAGIYNVETEATNVDETLLPTDVTGTSANVQTVVGNVTINCTSQVYTNGNASCDIDVIRGTNLQVTLDYTNGSPGTPISRTFPIADSLEFAMGWSVQEKLLDTDPAVQPSIMTGKILHHGNPATHQGFLVGFEYFAVNTGTLDVFVYRPICGPQTYCTDTNQCEASCTRNCGASIYCSSLRTCCSGAPVRSSALMTSYSLVKHMAQTVTQTGYGYFSSAALVDEILPGDIIAHDPSGGLLARVPPQPGQAARADYHCPTLAGTAVSMVTSGLCGTLTGDVHQLRAVYVDRTSVYVPLIFSQPGAVTMQVTVQNIDAAVGGSEVRSTVINVLGDVISDVALSPAGAQVNVFFQITVTWKTTFSGNVSVQVIYDGREVPMKVYIESKSAASPLQLETQIGGKPVTVSIWNSDNNVTFSQTFTIEEAIADAVLSCIYADEYPGLLSNVSYPVIKLNTGVNCTVNMTRGTSIVVNIDWGDGTNYNHNIGYGVDWSANPLTTQPITHIFTSLGYRPVRFSVQNDFHATVKDFPVMVMAVVDHVTMNSVLPVVFTPPSTVDFTWTVTTGPVPNGVTCEIAWGDNNVDVYSDCDVSTSMQHTYMDKAGDLTLQYKLSNLMSQKTGTVPVQVVSPIVDFECYSNPPGTAPTSNVELVAKMRRGPGAGVLDLTFDCDTSVAGTLPTRKRLYDSPDGEDKEVCVYPTVGTYTTEVRAQSVLENVLCTCTMHVQHPVTDAFSVWTDAEIDFSVTGNCLVTYRLFYTGVPVPDGASVVYDYGDGQTSAAIPFATANLPTDHTHTYSSTGKYITEMRIYNLGTVKTRMIPTGCYDAFSGLLVTVLREPDLPVGGPDVPGFGPGQDVFSVQEQIKLHTSLTTGTPVWWEVTAVNGSNVFFFNVTDTPVLSISIPMPGTFTISVQAKNPLYASSIVAQVIHLIHSAGQISVTDNNVVTRSNQNKTFDVTMSSYGTDMCVAVNDGWTSSVHLYGDTVTCQTDTSAWTNGVYDRSVNVSQPFQLIYVYPANGYYHMTITAWNYISNVTSGFQFAVSNIQCSPPNLDIEERRSIFRFPLKFLRSRRIKLIGLTELFCARTLINGKLWTAKRWNETTNTAIADVDLTSLSSSINSELSIDPLFLEYGLYRFEYTVTMQNTGAVNGELFTHSVETFIEVVKTNLVAQVFGNFVSSRTVGTNVILTLYPATYSYDPDIDPAIADRHVFDEMHLACRDVTLNEAFPNNTVIMVPYSSLADVPLGHTDIGGCFQQGPGWLEPLNGSVTFNTDILKPSHVYEFKVIGKKDIRSAFSYARVEVATDNTFDVAFIYKIPGLYQVSPEGRGAMFNPGSQLGMAVRVEVPCVSCLYVYEWALLAADYNYQDLYGGWRNLVYLDKHTQGVNSEELTVMPDVFQHYINVKDFQIRVKVTNSNTSAVGTAVLDMFRNTPPSGGNCTITPLVGVALNTNFTLTCAGFMDEMHDITNYHITCASNGRISDVCSGQIPLWKARTLPMGDTRNNHTLKCNVTVTDEYGSAASYPIHTVQVMPLSLSDLRSLVSSMSASTADRSDLLDAVANLDETISFCSALASMVDQMGHDDEYTEYAGFGTAVSYQNTDFGDTSLRPTAFHAVNFDETKMAEYEIIRDYTVRLMLLETATLTKCTVVSVQETILLTDTLAWLSHSREHLAKQTQTTMADLLDLSVVNMERNIQTQSVEEYELIAKNVLETMTNLEQAGTLNADHPSQTDLDTQKEEIPYYDTNHDTKQPGIDMYHRDRASLNAGKAMLNKEDQHKLVASIRAKKAKLMDRIINVFSAVKPASPVPTVLSTGSGQLTIIKSPVRTLVGRTIDTAAGTINIPPDILDGTPSDEVLIMTVISQSTPGVVKTHGPVNRFSREISITFKYTNGTVLEIGDLDTPVLIDIGQDPNRVQLDDAPIKSTHPEIVPTRTDEYLFYHQFEVTQPKAAIQLIFRPTNIARENQLLVLVNFNDLPVVSEGHPRVKQVCLIPRHTDLTGTYGSKTSSDPYTCYIDADLAEELGPGTWRIGVRQVNSTEMNAYKNLDVLPTTPPLSWTVNKTFMSDYKLKTAIVTCGYSADGSYDRKVDGLKPTSLSTSSTVQCRTSHLTSFGAGWVVAPNSLDWDFIFSNADFLQNPTLYITEIIILVVYVLAMIWARRADKKDLERLGLAPLLDNDHRDQYYYEIIVSTGLRMNGGTESTVCFILSGDEEETDVRTFTDRKRKIFQRGSTNGFVMAVTRDLGHLSYIRIWHDNSGVSTCASWYLNHIVIRDVQTDKKYYFIANTWFAVEEGDGMIDRVIPVAGREEMMEFSHLFQERASKNLSDGHLWLSVVTRPPSSRFTRRQRVSCCLCLLFTSMLANALFYEKGTSGAKVFTLGPFALTLEQLYIGAATNILIFPINFIIVTLFRKSRLRTLHPARLQVASKSKPNHTTTQTDVHARRKRPLSYALRKSDYVTKFNKGISSWRPRSRQEKCGLPWWFGIVAWILLVLTVLVSMTFTTFYGIMFQDIKCRKWISSMFVSFYMSVFFTQPIKVFLFAIFFSLIVKNPGGEEDDEEIEGANKSLNHDEEFLHESGYSASHRPWFKPRPLDQEAVRAAREHRLKEVKMWAVIREILFYMLYLWVLLVISYKSVSSDSYSFKSNLQTLFVKTNYSGHAFHKVKNVQDFWTWARTAMLRGLRAGPYYNNFPPFYLRGYIDDKVSRLMGHAILRQVRIRPGTCTLPPQMEDVIKECNGEHDMFREESENYGPSWAALTGSNHSREEYAYHSSANIDSYPYWGDMAQYGGGGYIVRLNKEYFEMVHQFRQLEAEKWIDKYTRAVFLEFTVYNPGINLFSVSTLVSEFRPSGGIFPSYRFEPCRLLPYNNSLWLFQIVCEIIHLLFTLFFLSTLVRNLYKQRFKYFTQFWNINDLFIIAMSVTGIVVYFYRLNCMTEITDYFRETNGNGFMNFQYVGYWSEIFNYIMGFLVFFATLKFLKLLRFNRKMSLLADTLRNSWKELMNFSIVFNVVFMAFIQVFYLLYHANLSTFKTFMTSCEAGIVMMMGKFDIYNMKLVNQWFTQIFLFLFVVSVTFIVVNMFLSILNDTFAAVRTDPAKQLNDYEIVDFIMARFKLWTGMGRPDPRIKGVVDRKDNQKQWLLEGQIDYFPNQVDRLLATVARVYAEKVLFDESMFSKIEMKLQYKNSLYTSYDDEAQPKNTAYHSRPTKKDLYIPPQFKNPSKIQKSVFHHRLFGYPNKGPTFPYNQSLFGNSVQKPFGHHPLFSNNTANPSYRQDPNDISQFVVRSNEEDPDVFPLSQRPGTTRLRYGARGDPQFDHSDEEVPDVFPRSQRPRTTRLRHAARGDPQLQLDDHSDEEDPDIHPLSRRPGTTRLSHGARGMTNIQRD